MTPSANTILSENLIPATLGSFRVLAPQGDAVKIPPKSEKDEDDIEG